MSFERSVAAAAARHERVLLPKHVGAHPLGDFFLFARPQCGRITRKRREKPVFARLAGFADQWSYDSVQFFFFDSHMPTEEAKKI